jgi:hypothetical protein
MVQLPDPTVDDTWTLHRPAEKSVIIRIE